MALLSTVRLNIGSRPNEAPLVFTPAAMNVFVGPNNSGKTLALTELAGHIAGAGQQRIIAGIQRSELTDDALRRFIEGLIDTIPAAPYREQQIIPLGMERKYRLRSNSHIWPSLTVLQYRESRERREFLSAFERYPALLGTIILSPETRLNLLNGDNGGDLQSYLPENALHTLFKDWEARERIRALTRDAFGLFFVVDATAMTEFRVRFSARPPEDRTEEEGLDARSRTFHGAARSAQEFSSGVRAFVGIVAALHLENPEIIIIDEAEAFLHPPLSRTLGRVLASTAADRGGHVFAATHSPDFLMGSILSGRSVNVIRLTYQQGTPSARLLDADTLRRLMRDPLLRNTGLLGAVFHNGAVVCEAPSDRVFYEELNTRLQDVGEGMKDVVFLNATNKQTLRFLIEPLRRLGIPAAVAVDLDIIKEGDLGALLRAAFVPEPLIDAWTQIKNRLNEAFRALGIDPKAGGINALNPPERESGMHMLVSAATYGVFIVPVGELEQWFSDLGVVATKNRWIEAIFQRMGSDPEAPEYVRPTNGDAWDFVRSIATWIANPERLGLP